MEQLSGLDAAFLALDTPSTTGHVGSIQVIEALDAAGEPVTLERLTTLVGERLPLVPPMRRKVVEVPLGLGQPFWVDDPHFDLEFHVRELALPAPGSLHQLTEQVARANPAWRFEVAHDIGHVPQLEAPDWTRDQMVGWLQADGVAAAEAARGAVRPVPADATRRVT